MYRIGICDDEKACRDVLREYCERLDKEIKYDVVCKEYISGESVIESEEDIDLLLLDVEMDGMNGIETMKRLIKKPHVRNIVFVSANSAYVYNAFGVKSRGYLCKPLEYEQFRDFVVSIIESDNENYLLQFTSENRNCKVPCGEVIYIEALDKCVKVVALDKEYIFSDTLSRWEKVLEEKEVIRVHKSYLVNLKFVKEIGKKAYMSIGDIEIPCGYAFRAKAKSRLEQYITNNILRR